MKKWVQHINSCFEIISARWRNNRLAKSYGSFFRHPDEKIEYLTAFNGVFSRYYIQLETVTQSGAVDIFIRMIFLESKPEEIQTLGSTGVFDNFRAKISTY